MELHLLEWIKESIITYVPFNLLGVILLSTRYIRPLYSTLLHACKDHMGLAYRHYSRVSIFCPTLTML